MQEQYEEAGDARYVKHKTPYDLYLQPPMTAFVVLGDTIL